MITGRSASRSSATARSSIRWSGAEATCGSASAGSASSASMKTWSSGKSMNAGPVCGRCIAAKASSISPGISAVAATVAASLTSGRTNGTWSISWSEPWPQRIAGARPPSTSIGRVVLLRGAQRAHPVRHARPGRERADPRLARHLRPALGREGGGGLVAHVDEVDALRPAAVVDREEMAAGEREQRRDAVRLEAAGDEAPSMHRGGLGGLGGHGGGTYPPNRGVRRIPGLAARARAV